MERFEVYELYCDNTVPGLFCSLGTAL